MKILMVCLGNICRSPIAEGLLKHKAKQHGLDWTVASAGMIANPGQTPHRFSQKICFSRGINISSQGARKFRPEMLQEYDKIYAMSEDVMEEILKVAEEGMDTSHVGLLLNESAPGRNDSVPDPINGPEPWFVIVYDMVNTACDAIINNYKDKQ